jgi:tRNA (adenine22-N1)-methyltransferase
MNSIGNRLEHAIALLEKCRNNELFADIGSDHAHFAIEAVRRNVVKSAIAADINEMPLEKGRENANSQGVNIKFVLSDGFENLENEGITSAAICGMGGELIAKIVLRSETARRCDLILQPMSQTDELRRALWDNGFKIDEEVFVTENRKVYTVMRAFFVGEKTEYTYTDLYLGKERVKSEEFREYCKKVLISAEKRRIGIVARNESTDDIDGLIKECQTQITSF